MTSCPPWATSRSPRSPQGTAPSCRPRSRPGARPTPATRSALPFSQAIARGLCENNPASELGAIAAPTPKAKQYPHLLEPELPAFLQALRRSTSRTPARVATWLVLLTASRPGVVRYAEWTEIDFDRALWSIPADKMKARRDHVTPLCRQALEALRELHRMTGRGRYLFPGIGAKQPVISENTINLTLNKVGYKGRLVGHGSRHTASTLHGNTVGKKTSWKRGSSAGAQGARRGRRLQPSRLPGTAPRHAPVVRQTIWTHSKPAYPGTADRL